MQEAFVHVVFGARVPQRPLGMGPEFGTLVYRFSLYIYMYTHHTHT